MMTFHDGDGGDEKLMSSLENASVSIDEGATRNSRALSPHLDSKISIHRHICNFVHIEVIGIAGKGAVVWGIEWIVEKGRRGPITALGRRDNGAAKG